MDGFNMNGKAFCVVEDLRQFAEKHKGKTVSEVLRERRRERLEKAVEQQVGEPISFKKI